MYSFQPDNYSFFINNESLTTNSIDRTGIDNRHVLAWQDICIINRLLFILVNRNVQCMPEYNKSRSSVSFVALALFF